MWPFILSDRLLIVALVGLYPHQLANQTQAHLQAEAFSEASFSKCLMRYSYIHSVLAPLSKCCPHLEGRLLTRYSPVRHLVFTEINTPFDLHVLSTPPAFVLSQAQTLQDRLFVWLDYFLPITLLNCGIISYPHIGFIVRCTVQFSKNQSL